MRQSSLRSIATMFTENWDPTCASMKAALHSDVLVHIMTYLDFGQRETAREVCREWDAAGRTADLRAVKKMVALPVNPKNFSETGRPISATLLCDGRLVLTENLVEQRSEFRLHSLVTGQEQNLGRNRIRVVTNNKHHVVFQRCDGRLIRGGAGSGAASPLMFMLFCVHSDGRFHLLKTCPFSKYAGSSDPDSKTVAETHNGGWLSMQKVMPWNCDSWARLLTLVQSNRMSQCKLRNDTPFYKENMNGVIGQCNVIEYSGERFLLLLKREGIVLVDIEGSKCAYGYAHSLPKETWAGGGRGLFSTAVVCGGEGKFQHITKVRRSQQEMDYKVCFFDLKRPRTCRRPEAYEHTVTINLEGTQELCLGRLDYRPKPQRDFVDIVDPSDGSVKCSFPMMLPFTPRKRLRNPSNFGIYRITREHYILSDLVSYKSMIADCRRKTYTLFDGGTVSCGNLGIMVGRRNMTMSHQTPF